MLGILTRICDLIDAFCRYLLIFMCIEITLIVSLNVAGRYLLDMPTYWAEEITRYTFVWMTFIGAACAYKRRQLVAMSLLANKFSPSMRKNVGLAVELVMAAFLVTALVFSAILVAAASRQTSASLSIPMNYVYLCLPISFLFMLVFNLTQVLTMLKTHQSLPGWGEDWS